DSETAKPGYVFRAVAGTDTTAVLIIVPIENVVATVLDRPVAAIDLENALRASVGGGSTGEAVGDFAGSLTGLFLGHVPLDDESLSHVGKVEIAVEFGGGPDFARFQASMIGGRMLDEMRLAPILEVELQGFQQSRLVAFDGEVVMRVAFLDQIGGETALGEQSMGTDLLALNLDGVQQRDGHFDFVGA